jgi:transcriptional regulator with XRE-family HTH domain
MAFDIELQKKIKAAFFRSGWTQVRLAKKSGYGQWKISQILNGKGNHSEESLIKILNEIKDFV